MSDSELDRAFERGRETGHREGAQTERASARFDRLEGAQAEDNQIMRALRRDLEGTRTEMSEVREWIRGQEAREEQMQRNAARIASSAERQEQRFLSNRMFWSGIGVLVLMSIGIIIAALQLASVVHH